MTTDHTTESKATTETKGKTYNLYVVLGRNSQVNQEDEYMLPNKDFTHVSCRSYMLMGLLSNPVYVKVEIECRIKAAELLNRL